MNPQLPELFIPLAYLIPAFVAFFLGYELRKRFVRTGSGIRYLKMLYFLCLAEGVHNTYYFFATLFRMTNPQIYEAMMLPVPWLMAQGIITLTFIAFGFCFLSERHIEFGDIGAEKERANAFRELATVDPLTGLRNRRTFTEMLEQERKRACRMERPLTLALLDLDGFKGVNDTQGHKAGDDVLKTVAGYIKSGLRQGIDIPFRYGGDEFFIIFPETDLHMAQAIAERMKSEVKFATNGQITLSIGLLDATLASHLTPEELVHQVDEAMYAAKKGGGDSIVSATCSAKVPQPCGI